MRRVLPVLVVVLATTSGCGFLNDLSHPPAAQPQPSTAAAAPTTQPPPTVVDGDLRTTGGAAGGHLTVTLGTPRTGLAPPIVNSAGCHFYAPSLEFLPVRFATPPGLAAHVEISTGPATPSDIGDVGIFVESGNGEQVYCTDYPPLPTQDKFFNQSGAPTLTAWVVLGHAVTPALPGGRPEVFPTLRLRISDLRRLADATTVEQDSSPEPSPSVRPAPTTPRAICVPLG